MVAENKKLLDFVINAEPEVVTEKWPWLIAVNGGTWTIEDGAGSKRKQSKLNMNPTFAGGKPFKDIWKGKAYYITVDYSEVLRMQMPEITAAVHIGRIKALQCFFAWLDTLKIQSLSEVTPTHLEHYAQKVRYGREFVLEAPQSVLAHIVKVFANGEETSIAKHNVIIRGAIPNKVIGNYFQNSSLTTPVYKWGESVLRMQQTKLDYSKTTFIEVLEEQGVEVTPQTVQTIQRNLLPIEELYQFQGYLNYKTFDFVPFRKGAAKVAANLGVDTNRTRSIPPKIAFAYIQEAARVVLKLGPIVEKYIKGNADVDELNAALSFLGLSSVKVLEDFGNFYSVHHGKASATGIVRVVAAACFVVIASLTGRRKEEIYDLGEGCWDGNDDIGYYLTIYIEKTLRRYDRKPIPNLTQRAIALMESISAGAREINQSDSIWQYLTPEREIEILGSAYAMDDLFHLTLPEMREESGWVFTAHQYRRFFALIYYYRYEDAHLGTLSYHLRHFDIEMTKRYVTDKEFMKELREVSAEWSASVLRGVQAGTRSLEGRGANKLAKKLHNWTEHFRGIVDVVAPQLAVEKMFRYLKHVGAEFRQQLWGSVCVCPENTKLASKSNCADSEGKPQFDIESGNLCRECPFNLRDKKATSHHDSIDVELDISKLAGRESIFQKVSSINVIPIETLLGQKELVLESDNDDS
ncbi:MAG: hypothetical protein ABW097_08800 [Candidatus Thiodiazotropha lotti]